MKKIYLKHIHILENIVHICIINDLSYPPANNQNAFFLFTSLLRSSEWVDPYVCLTMEKSPQKITEQWGFL